MLDTILPLLPPPEHELAVEVTVSVVEAVTV